ncbi:hypothetical protein CL614_09645 [archaeon]|nr:hypothetical protein [archaeon]|tara:strand:+ start:148 stop:336 length:189 start_codon:yes stop_codon:yes gene_type:complete
MNINNFIQEYYPMITTPLAVNNKFGFELSSGIRWYFKNSFLSDESKRILQRAYKKLKEDKKI